LEGVEQVSQQPPVTTASNHEADEFCSPADAHHQEQLNVEHESGKVNMVSTQIDVIVMIASMYLRGVELIKKSVVKSKTNELKSEIDHDYLHLNF